MNSPLERYIFPSSLLSNVRLATFNVASHTWVWNATAGLNKVLCFYELKELIKSFVLAIVHKTLAQFPRWISNEMFCMMNDFLLNL